MANIKNISNKNIVIKPFRKEYITEKYVSWLNDKDVTKYSEQRHHQHTIGSCIEFLDFNKKNNNIFYAVFLKINKLEHIGNILAYVDLNNNSANLTILIGEKKYWGLGYGLEAWTLMLNYLLKNLKIRKVCAGTVNENYGMLKIMKMSGMLPDGIRVKEKLVGSKELDMIYTAKFNNK